ncbi:MAG: hypothetical protein LC808_34685 [Actinobacteria bacterium]|nr:hypothetical protein [Actinomycetota bacterium]
MNDDIGDVRLWTLDPKLVHRAGGGIAGRGTRCRQELVIGVVRARDVIT